MTQTPLGDEIDRLREANKAVPVSAEELEELRRDAARYRAIRVMLHWFRQYFPHAEDVDTAIDAAIGITPIKYGCHCDLESMDPGFQPDDCVFDDGDIDDCICATKLQREGKGKLDCEYWKPITVKHE